VNMTKTPAPPPPPTMKSHQSFYVQRTLYFCSTRSVMRNDAVDFFKQLLLRPFRTPYLVIVSVYLLDQHIETYYFIKVRCIHYELNIYTIMVENLSIHFTRSHPDYVSNYLIVEQSG